MPAALLSDQVQSGFQTHSPHHVLYQSGGVGLTVLADHDEVGIPGVENAALLIDLPQRRSYRHGDAPVIQKGVWSQITVLPSFK